MPNFIHNYTARSKCFCCRCFGLYQQWYEILFLTKLDVFWCFDDWPKFYHSRFSYFTSPIIGNLSTQHKFIKNASTDAYGVGFANVKKSIDNYFSGVIWVKRFAICRIWWLLWGKHYLIAAIHGMKPGCCHDANFVVTCVSGGCRQCVST